MTYLQSKLSSLDGGDVSTRSTTDNDDIVWLGLGSESSRGDSGRSEETARKGVGGGRVSKGSEKIGRLKSVSISSR